MILGGDVLKMRSDAEPQRAEPLEQACGGRPGSDCLSAQGRHSGEGGME